MLVSDLPRWFWLASAGAVGLCIGSFLNVVIYRLPRGMSLLHPPSTCPGCGARIPFYLNVPVLGYLVLRGRARCCGMRVDARYPLIEACGGLLALAVVEMRVLPDPAAAASEGVLAFVLYFTLSAGLLAAAFIDLEHMILPDGITLGGAALGLLSAGVRPETTYLTSAAFGFVGFFIVWFPFIWAHKKLRGFAGMGLGDAKLLALAGTWFGGPGVLFVLFGGALQGTLATLAVLLLGRPIEEPEAVKEERREIQEQLEHAVGEEREELKRLIADDPVLREPDGGVLGARIPFGPFLALAALELTLFYEPIMTFLNGWLWL